MHLPTHPCHTACLYLTRPSTHTHSSIRAGMHRVKMHHLRQEMHFVIMASVFDTDKAIHRTYDLKGSTIGWVVTCSTA